MRDAFIDVELQLNEAKLIGKRNRERFILELSRETAEERCAEAGATLRTDRAPEIVIGKGTDPLTGNDLVLVASRWHVIVPEGVPLGGPGAVARP